MTKDTAKRKTSLVKNLRGQVKDWATLFDSLAAIHDPHAAKIVAEQLQCTYGHLSETVELIGEMTSAVTAATLTLDLDQNQLTLTEHMNGVKKEETAARETA